MSTVEIISLVVTLVCVVSFSVVFTILFRNYYMTNIESVKAGREDTDLIEQAIYEENQSKSKGKKIAKKVFRISEYVILGLISAFFLFSLYSRFTGNSLPFGEYSMIVIATDSMSIKNSNNSYLEDNELDNQFDAYDIIGVSPYHSQDEVQLYDVVAYKDDHETIIVHRIRVIETLSDGTIVYHTRGDKNAIDDDNNRYGAHLTYDRIIGHYNGNRIKNIGIFIIFVQSNAGIITIVSIVYCLLMYDRFNNKYEKAVEERTNTLISLLDYDINVDDASDFIAQYKETVIYKGTCYIFEKGEFVTKLPVEGLNMNQALAEEATGAKLALNEPEQKVSSSLPEDLPEKEESLSMPSTPTSIDSEEADEESAPEVAAPEKAEKVKKFRKKPKKEKDFESFLDHLDDTEDIP